MPKVETVDGVPTACTIVKIRGNLKTTLPQFRIVAQLADSEENALSEIGEVND